MSSEEPEDSLRNFSWDEKLPSPSSPSRTRTPEPEPEPLPSSRLERFSLDSSFTQEEKDEEPFEDDEIPILPEFDLDIEETSASATETSIKINDLLETLLDRGGSDIHLSAKAHPTIRVNGDMVPLEDYPRLSGAQIRNIISAILSEAQLNRFDDEWELDTSYTLPGRSRFRVNVLKQLGNTGVVMRAIPWEILTAEDLGLPDIVNDFSQLPRGLVLVTGPTGSGKSTTLAAIIDRANRTRPAKIITVEDPIEFVHEHRRSIIDQREVGTDTKSFSESLKRVLRQDPDIILVGEMRDLETISVALTAAETGHLVLGTLHTQSARETVTRIIDVFPEGEKAHVQTQLAASLQAVVSQTLLKKREGGRVAALEIMKATDPIRNQIREGHFQQIQSSLETGARDGQQTLESELKKLVESGVVHWEEAASKVSNRKDFIATLGGETGIQALERRLAVAQKQGW